MIYPESSYNRPWRFREFLPDGLVKYTNEETFEEEIVDVQKQLIEKDGFKVSEIYGDVKDIETFA